MKLFIPLLFIISSLTVKSQTFIQLSELTKSASLNDVRISLVGYGFSYTTREDVKLNSVPKNSFYFIRHDADMDADITVIVFQEPNKKGFSLEYVTYSSYLFNSEKLKFEGNKATKFLKEEMSGGTYNRYYSNNDFMFMMGFKKSERYPDKNMFMVAMVNLKDYR